MKKVFVLAMFMFLMFCTAGAQESPAQRAATRTAQKMTDSLGLSPDQNTALFTANMQLNNEKLAAKQQFSDPAALRQQLLTIESKRDSLYRPVLTEAQYQSYLQKKTALLGPQ